MPETIDTVLEMYLSPQKIAKSLGVHPTKVLTWIRSGELTAINIATNRGVRPRWRVTPAALAAFLETRKNRPPVKLARRRGPRAWVHTDWV